MAVVYGERRLRKMANNVFILNVFHLVCVCRASLDLQGQGRPRERARSGPDPQNFALEPSVYVVRSPVRPTDPSTLSVLWSLICQGFSVVLRDFPRFWIQCCRRWSIWDGCYRLSISDFDLISAVRLWRTAVNCGTRGTVKYPESVFGQIH